MKKELTIVLILVLAIAFSNFATSIGFAPSKYTLAVQPNNKYVINYQVMGVSNFDIEAECDPLLKKYIEISKITTDEKGIHKFSLTFDFPNEIEKQGHESVGIIVKEKPEHERSEGKHITGLTVVEGRINIDIPYEGLYAEMLTKIFNANQGEEVQFDVTMKNFGQVDIKKSYVEIEIYKDEKKIKTIISDKVPIMASSSHQFSEYLSTNDLKPGIYNAKITGFYDSKKRETKPQFKIGTLDILITDFTKDFYVNETNELFIQIESLWNNHIEKVFADLTISKENKVIKEFPTPNYDLKPWASQKIITYLKTQNWELGEYDFKIKLNFEGETKIINEKINIINRPEPEKPFDLFGLSTTAIILITVTLFMVVINAFLITNILKNRNTKKGRKKTKKK